VNKSQLIDALAERIGDKKAAGAAVDGLVEVIVRSVQKGEKVNITGFGVFEKRARAARTARNPRTGESVKVKKTNVPAFRAGSTFKDVVSGVKKLPKVAAGAKASTRSTAARSTSARATATATTTRKAGTTAKAPTARAGAATKAAPKPTARKATTTRSTTARSTTTRSTGTAAKKPAAKATPAKSAAKPKTAAKTARPAAKKATSTAPKKSSRGKK
jgi:DNA-binding protein HU-beta